MFKKINILKIFFESPNKNFNVREVARIFKISPATISKELKIFAKESILLETKERRFNFYKANLDSSLYRDIKVFYNIRNIKESGIIEEINNFYLKPTIILFGSCGKGIDTENSDMDLVIISEKTSNFNKKSFYEKKLKRQIQIFAIKNIKDLKNPHLISNVLNGIVLQGEIKWI
jgi:predicted nucleotidyltransferase